MARLPKRLRESNGRLSDEEREELWQKCTPKQKKWLEEYMTNGFNQTAAARAAYEGQNGTFRRIGHDNRYHPRLSRLIDDFFRAGMPEVEAMSRMSEIARGSMADLVTINEETGNVEIDLQKAKDNGALGIIKDLKITRKHYEDRTDVTIHLKTHDKTKALKEILRAHGAFRASEAPVENHKHETNIFQQINNQIKISDE